MVKIIRTHEMDPDKLSQFERDMCYNGLDCCITHDVFNGLVDQLDEQTSRTYSFSKALQAPTLEMRCRGVLIDQVRKAEVVDEYFDKIDHLERQLERIVFDGVGMDTFNWRSNQDLQRLFYEYLELPVQRFHGKPTTNRGARDALAIYPLAQPIVNHLNLLWDIGDKISVLQTAIDPDGRMRTSYNIAGTSTGRFSSSFSEFGTGGNLQNVEESLRSIFIADPGMKFAKFDAKSGESYCVGAKEWNLFRDGKFLDACESGDPHTWVAKLVWPKALPWTGDLEQDKKIAEDTKYFRQHSYRFMCKKIGHGSNYFGQPPAIAQQTQIPEQVIEVFQTLYFNAFPAHRRWHEWTDNQLRDKGYLTTLTGRKRYFFGRRHDPRTFRKAIAYDPQGTLADLVNTAMLNLWRLNLCPIVMHDHDALTFMYPEEVEDEIIPQIMSHLVVPIPLEGGRELRIPYDCQTGWNKGKFNAEKNPDGLKDYQGQTDQRRRSPTVSLLDRVVHRANPKLGKPTPLPPVDGHINNRRGFGAKGVVANKPPALPKPLHNAGRPPWSR